VLIYEYSYYHYFYRGLLFERAHYLVSLIYKWIRIYVKFEPVGRLEIQQISKLSKYNFQLNLEFFDKGSSGNQWA